MGINNFSNRIYTRSYKDFRGVDLCGKGAQINESRLSACINMYKDYEAEGAPVIESVPGYRRIVELPSAIKALYRHPTSQGDALLIHSGGELYRLAPHSQSAVLVSELASDKSTGFCQGKDFYILSGGELTRVDEEGTCKKLGQDGAMPYVPIIYQNGEPYEQRNLLTDEFIETFNVGEYELYSHGTPGLKYEITDSDAALCAVVGIDQSAKGVIYIPGKTRIGDTVYRVEEIKDNAFAYNGKLTGVYIGEGVRRIGKFAFRYCNYITKMVTPKSLTAIDNAAFMDCARLTDLYLCTGLAEIGAVVFSACIYLKTINYDGDEETLQKVKNNEALSSYTVNYGVSDRSCLADIALSSPAKTVSSVTVNGSESPFTVLTDSEGVTRVVIPLSCPADIIGKRVAVGGTLSSGKSEKGGYSDFLSTPEGQSIGGRSAILGCTVTECFDGRVFYSGNPSLPNTVFYSARKRNGQTDPLYIGGYCYFNDGIGAFPVISMLSVRDSLTVFKAGDDGTGSIFYHTVKETGEDLVPKVYPVSYVHSGLCAKGQSLNFLDDPVFISSAGLSAIKQSAINYERSIAVRSHNVNYELLRESLPSATLTEWLGYLVVGCGSHVYLADSRATFTHDTGNTEYEWFYLCGIGEWKNASRVFRYASDPKDGMSVHPYPDTVCNEVVYSRQSGDGLVYYCVIGGVEYGLCPTEERQGGDFYPATVFLGIGDLLYFGTEGGSLMVFNTDKRGVPPSRLSSLPDFDPEDYRERMGRQIHPDFYAFDDHAAFYALTTLSDDCGVPNMTKATLKNSTVLKCKAYVRGSLTVDVSTDVKGYSQLTEFSPGELNFHELDFSRMSLSSGEFVSVPINERERGWIDKQYTLYSNSYCCPLGICSLTYRYTLHGNVKRR